MVATNAELVCCRLNARTGNNFDANRQSWVRQTIIKPVYAASFFRRTS